METVGTLESLESFLLRFGSKRPHDVGLARDETRLAQLKCPKP